MPGVADHILFLVLALLGPVWAATLGYRRLRRAPPDALPRVRISVYRGALAMQWTLAAFTLALWLWTGRSFSALGLAPRFTWGFAGVALGVAIVIAVIAHQRRQAIEDDEALAEVRERMRHIGEMIPRTPRELRWFFALSVTAGICEEVLYRGFMIWYLASGVGVLGAAVVSSVLFGVGHSYQGSRGMLLTGMVGAFLAAVYLVSGSLLWPIVIHALMDIHSGHLAYVALEREPAPPAAAHVDTEWGAPWPDLPELPDAEEELAAGSPEGPGAGEEEPASPARSVPEQEVASGRPGMPGAEREAARDSRDPKDASV